MCSTAQSSSECCVGSSFQFGTPFLTTAELPILFCPSLKQVLLKAQAPSPMLLPVVFQRGVGHRPPHLLLLRGSVRPSSVLEGQE